MLASTVILYAAASGIVSADDERQSYKIYVDEEGVMRRDDNHREVSYFGTNYTLPFAHPYRACGYLGKDRKRAIEQDVEHMARLGFNGFRLHLWDVELSDSVGNLQSNEHLDLLDYMLAELRKRGIDVVLTAQTNFGNGYPERNRNTGGYSYLYDKCEIHASYKAQAAQRRYLEGLVRHVNPYTGLSYGADNSIIAMEINNEPCHKGSVEQTRNYIDSMAGALRDAGWDKPVLYNVSHNPEVTKAYYESGAEGTTYQWYPTGLVANRERRGNYLPAVDAYTISWRDTMPGFGSKARLVYEFDPADELGTYLYPAMARSLREAGFQWATQFAYDPTVLAAYNTDYQTHYMNLGYTPGKALSLMIAGEAMRTLKRGGSYGAYPRDTVFDDFRVSYRDNLSELNSGRKFIYSNSTRTEPKSADMLEQVAGVGSSPVVEYDGTGAYFLDRVAEGVWRLEVMPDVMLVGDPFEKPSLKRRVGKIVYGNHKIRIMLPELGDSYVWRGINRGNNSSGTSSGATMDVRPGVYLLSRDAEASAYLTPPGTIRNIGMAEYEAPEATGIKRTKVVHHPATYSAAGDSVRVSAQIFGEELPASVVIYPSDVSFWREDNRLYPMRRKEGYTYEAVIPTDSTQDNMAYNIVVIDNDKISTTWPQGDKGTPLDWDFDTKDYYRTTLLHPTDSVELFRAGKGVKPDASLLDDNFTAWSELIERPVSGPEYRIHARPDTATMLIVRTYTGDAAATAPNASDKKMLAVKVSGGTGSMRVGVITRDGATFTASANPTDGMVRIPLSSLEPTPWITVPAPFPTLLPRTGAITQGVALRAEDIEFVEIRRQIGAGSTEMSVWGAWLE